MLWVGASGKMNLNRNLATAVELSVVVEFEVSVVNGFGAAPFKFEGVAMSDFRYACATTLTMSEVLLPHKPGAVPTDVHPEATLQ